MPQQVVPMIHVPDVGATIDWYRSLGFKLRDQGKEGGGEIVWAALTEDLHDTFYGKREFIIRDLNRFWITFGPPMRKWLGQGRASLELTRGLRRASLKHRVLD